MRNFLTGRGSSSRRTRTRLNGPRAAVALAGVLVALVAVLGVSSAAWAAVDDPDNTVTGVSPRGTTINLFDYWISGRDDPDNSNPDNYLNRGINSENSAFKFGGIAQSEAPYEANRTNVNNWTKSAHPRTGIVADDLGEDGYPTLSSVLGGDSLSYLFDSSSFEGKAAYADVDGLLQVDDDGYYYYNSRENFAQFNDDGHGSGDFTLYNTWGVNAGGASPNGQFFPFNTGEQVFDEAFNGITQKNLNSKNSAINHYFGLNMSTRFVQQDGGYTAPVSQGGKEVTYNFSGDDDVWIFIDGVLVGDLGGVHDATSIEINFATGRVVVYDDFTFDAGDQRRGNNQYDQGETVYNGNGRGENLAEIMRAAGVNNGLAGNTFADGTYHTLDFFYLERGNTDSNMSLKYNLVNIPESGVVKVDQYGKALGGVSFTLQQTNDQYEVVQNGRSVSGKTDNQGKFIFTYKNASGQEMPITLEQLETVSPYWVLIENGVPAGYRSAGEMHLRFENGFLLSSNEWDTGAYSQPHVTVTAPTTLYGLLGDGGQGPEVKRTDDGFIFAVVLQKDEDTNQWFPVSGNALDGWTVADSADTAAVAAAAQTNPDNYRFRLGSGGADEVTIDNLPGDVNTYSYVLTSDDDPSNDGDAKYTIGYYYCTDGNLENSSSNNIQRLYPDAQGSNGFDRIFSVTLNVPNVKNELTLVKTDADGTENLAGAVYALYVDANGNGQVDADEQPVAEGMTTDRNGMVEIYSSVDEKLLANGNYVLAETEAPTDYVLDTTSIRIVVDNDGVHVNAGTADDNVTVETGIGDLVYSMKGFAAGDDVDATLHDVNATAQTSDAYSPSTAWTDDPNATVSHFLYDDQVESLSYKLNNSVTPNGFDGNGASTYTADAGWSRLNIQQCLNHSGDMTNGPKQDLSTEGVTDLNALFTGDVTIHVTNEKIPTTASLTISKKVDGQGAPADDYFSFDVVFANEDDPTAFEGEKQFTLTTVSADGAQSERQITVVDGVVGKTDGITREGIFLEAGEKATLSGLPLGTTYTVTERDTSHPDMDGRYLVGVEATPAGGVTIAGATAEGTLTAAQEYQLLYTNTYVISLDTSESLIVVKKLEGKDLSGRKGDPNNFEFVVTPTNGTGTTAEDAYDKLGLTQGDEGLTNHNPSASMVNGVATSAGINMIHGIEFGPDDIGKTYAYLVSEIIPEGAVDNNDGTKTLGAYTYDALVHEVTYSVFLNNEGVLDLSVSVDNVEVAQGTPSVTFNNSYKPLPVTTDAGFSGTKTVTDEHGEYELNADDFTFVITNDTAPTGVTAPKPSKGSEVKNDADGNFDFGTITFTEPGEYTYTVSEKTSGITGITNGGERYTLYFDIIDDGGQLKIQTQRITNKAGVEVGSTDLDFTNIYNDGKVSYQIAGTKIFDNGGADNETLGQGDFTFALYEVGADGSETRVQEVSNGVPAGNTAGFSFDAITYTAEGTHTYKVYELGADGRPGTGGIDANRVEHSDAVYTVKVTVTKDADAQGAGGLAVTADVQNADIKFVNAYTPESVVVGPNGSAQIGGGKELTGRDLRTGEFSFELRGGGQVIETVTNDADGNFMFGDLAFDAPGTYYYSVSEVNNGAGGVTYDAAVYNVCVDVTNNADAHVLEARVTYTDANDNPVNDITFANTYEAAGTTASLSVTKELKDGALAAGQFSFELTGSGGAPMPEATTATNSANGVVVFGPISFDTVGEYDYTVTEVNDGQDGIAYDENADRTIHVSVTDNGEGALVAKVTYGEDGSHFVNTATTDGGGDQGDDGGNHGGTKPSNPKDTIPRTGDRSFAFAPALALLGAATAGGVLIRGRMRRE